MIEDSPPRPPRPGILRRVRSKSATQNPDQEDMCFTRV